ETSPMSKPSRRGRGRPPGMTTETQHLLGEARALRDQGLSLEEIGRRLGVTHQYLSHLLGPTPRASRTARRWSAEEDALLGTLPDTELAGRLGCSAFAVRR